MNIRTCLRTRAHTRRPTRACALYPSRDRTPRRAPSSAHPLYRARPRAATRPSSRARQQHSTRAPPPYIACLPSFVCNCTRTGADNRSARPPILPSLPLRTASRRRPCLRTYRFLPHPSTHERAMEIAALVCSDPEPIPGRARILPQLPAPFPPPPPLSAAASHLAASPSSMITRLPAARGGARRVTCHLCGKSFSGVSSHNRHVSRTHHKARPFGCTQCAAWFGQKGSLERHVAGVHRKERPFACAHCGKQFGRSDNLRIHISTVHLKERPHKCPSCPKRFGGKRPLKIHQQTVHLKQRPLECPLCARRFGQRSNLNAHLRHVHKQQPPAHPAVHSFTAPTPIAHGSSLPLGIARISALAGSPPLSASPSESSEDLRVARPPALETFPPSATALRLIGKPSPFYNLPIWGEPASAIQPSRNIL